MKNLVALATFFKVKRISKSDIDYGPPVESHFKMRQSLHTLDAYYIDEFEQAEVEKLDSGRIAKRRRARAQSCPADPLHDMDSNALEKTAEPQAIDTATQIVKKALIGAGSSAMVVKATYLGQSVAVKEFFDSAMGRTQFENELKFAELLPPHENILKATAVCESASLQFLVFPYVAQGDLSKELNRLRNTGVSLDWDRIGNRLAYDVISALSYLHSHKVIHFDVQPRNILLGEQGAVLADFGISRLESMHTRSYATYYKYRAPEVVSKGTITRSADIYSFGVVLWEMLTLKPVGVALECGTDNESGQFSFNLDSQTDGPEYIKKTIRRCLLFDPSKRPTSECLKKELEAVMHKEKLN